jgi:Plasmid maintenance system killer protein
MEVESVSHKALRRFIETGKPRGLPADVVDRLLRMVSFLMDAGSPNELATPPNYGFDELKGDRKGTFAMTVTPNWLLTFEFNEHSGIIDLDLEDYH